MSEKPTELREFAERILETPEFAGKLAPPEGPFVDENPGAPARVDIPSRTADLRFQHGKRGAKMPSDESLGDERCRGAAHHIMANHELQALEAMAWTLLAFPEAPKAFRRGLAQILQEEQEHARWHAERAAELGVPFGSRRVAGYVWRRTTTATTPLEYLACLPLTFEQSNL
ncbi:MAG TPA: DUF455 family protein, partial [Planctomycetia bacterium]|nr:DUF455 family protein [Planctomycetia bacterium]